MQDAFKVLPVLPKWSLRLWIRIIAIAVLAVHLVPAQATDIRLVIDNTGKQEAVYIGNPRIWNFTITSAGAAAGLSAISGNFAIKDNADTSEPIVFTLYSGYNGTGTILASSSLSSSVTTNQYVSYLFPITPTGSLAAGGYSLTLSSNTASGGSNQYFVKNGGATNTSPPEVKITTSDGTPLNSSYFSNGVGPTPTPGPSPTPTPVPEPGQVAASLLLAAGIAVYWFLKRKKQAPSA